MEERAKLEHLEKYMPYPFWKRGELGNKVYGEIYLDEITYWGEDAAVRVRISASLVNEKMLNMEYDARERSDTPLFFYEFTGEKIFDSISDLAKHKIGEGWKTSNYYVMRLIDIGESDAEFDLVLQEYKKQVVFVGEVIFSASPILSHKAAIVIEESVEKADKDTYDKLQKTYSSWSNEIKKECIYDKAEIVKELDKLFGSNTLCKSVDIYNVGQANCCYCDLDLKKVFFDIGVTRSEADRESTLIKRAIQEISALNVDAVILSHWDLDHILGVCYNRICTDKKIWLVPDFEKLYGVPRISIKRLCNYLLRNGKSKLMMVDTTDADKLLYESNNKAVSVYMGEPKASEGINKMNNGGLVLKLQNSKNILLPGDCENRIVPQDALQDEFDNVLIPHHGSAMSKPRIKGKRGRKNIAYLSCGKITGNCNIDSDISKNYKKNGFQSVRKTMNLKKNTKYTIVL